MKHLFKSIVLIAYLVPSTVMGAFIFSGGNGSDLVITNTSVVTFNTSQEFTNTTLPTSLLALVIDGLYPVAQTEYLASLSHTGSISGSQGSVWGNSSTSGVSELGGVYDLQDLFLGFAYTSGSGVFGTADTISVNPGTMVLSNYIHALPDAGSYTANIVMTNGEIVAIPEGIVITLAAVPLPASMWLLSSGLIGLVCVARRKQRRLV